MEAIPKLRPACVMKRSPLFCWSDVSNMCLAVLESERACKLVNTRYVSELTSAGRRARDQMRIHGGTRAVGEQSGLTGGPTAMAIGGRHHSARGTGRIRTGS